ncbi:MAG: Tn3 family transposase [Armatimonadetes bacterium]|nr:Tn3 family transposase [Armatimonadota bacterium]
MKRLWNDEDLVAHFTLLPQDRQLLQNKTEATRLGFAVMLKCFQQEGRFPARHEIPFAVIRHIADQIELHPELFVHYPTQGRTAEYHRAQIREALGFRPSTEADSEAILRWMDTHILPQERDPETLTEIFYTRCRALRLEPPAPKRLSRWIQSALRLHEETFCSTVLQRLSPAMRSALEALLRPPTDEEMSLDASEEDIEEPEADAISGQAWLYRLKAGPGEMTVKTVLKEIAKLQRLRALELPAGLFTTVPPKILQRYRQRVNAEEARDVRRHPEALRLTLLAVWCHLRIQEITDGLLDLLNEMVHTIDTRAERKVQREMVKDFKRVVGKNALLFQIARASLQAPEGKVREVVYPIADEQTLKDLVAEWEASANYDRQVQQSLRNSYSHHYRRMVPHILEALSFHSNNALHRPVLEALELLKQHIERKSRYFPLKTRVLIKDVVKPSDRNAVVEIDAKGRERVHRIPYEVCVLKALREKLRCREIWTEGAARFRKPDDDLPANFEAERTVHYQALALPEDGEEFLARTQRELTQELQALDKAMPKNPAVKFLEREKGRLCLTPLAALPDPPHLDALKAEVNRRWPLTSLLDMLKETDLRVGFTEAFKSPTPWEKLDRETLQRRLLLCLYGLGTNAGIKSMCAGEHGESYKDLLYVHRRYITNDHLRNAITQVVNAILRVRHPDIWGEGTTACASDSKQFGSWDQNLMTEWHIRYRGPGVMIYWHVEKKSACIYSQLKRCSSSEVASMIQGLLRHNTEMNVAKNYVDTHGQSEVAFAFCSLLGFELLPRLKGLHRQKLARPESGKPEDYPHLQPVLAKPIDWELIRRQYDEMVKYATALRLGTTDAETILRRFTRNNVQHPTYKALAEWGRARKTIFLCRYLRSEALRREIQQGLNVVENWNSANSFILYGKGGELASNSPEDQERTMLCLHLLQNSMAYINTLMLQQILAEPEWRNRLQAEDRRALTPLFYLHVHPYGWFDLDLTKRLPLELPMAA